MLVGSITSTSISLSGVVAAPSGMKADVVNRAVQMVSGTVDEDSESGDAKGGDAKGGDAKGGDAVGGSTAIGTLSD